MLVTDKKLQVLEPKTEPEAATTDPPSRLGVATMSILD
jgi:hypothetical protein